MASTATGFCSHDGAGTGPRRAGAALAGGGWRYGPGAATRRGAGSPGRGREPIALHAVAQAAAAQPEPACRLHHVAPDVLQGLPDPGGLIGRLVGLGRGRRACGGDRLLRGQAQSRQRVGVDERLGAQAASPAP